MQTTIHEIADGVYRFSTIVPEAAPGGFAFNQYLITDDEPLLFHTGPRQLFPLISDAVAKVIDVDKLRWISFGHVESDESGSMNLWLEAAPTSEVLFNPLGCMATSEWVESCRFVAAPGPDWIEQLERNLARASDQVYTVDMDLQICPFLPICDPIVGDTVVFFNGVHLAESYSRSLAPELGTHLEAQGLIG